MENHQYGLGKHKGTRQAILELRNLIEKQISQNKVTYVLFIDIKFLTTLIGKLCFQ